MLEVGQKWTDGSRVDVVTAVQSDGEVGYRHVDYAGAGTPHWCKGSVFVATRTLVVDAPAVSATVVEAPGSAAQFAEADPQAVASKKPSRWRK